ncbi:hypothetical protein CNEO4_440037 [Clostridium neonatale]|uniref:Uncharacterized protein n=1 Tax=Clostridium neonatale TaxID=137838 RepID=A0AA86MPA8_9CLOT|nr:hypothetical protein CNEO_44422 [Clostridium neonatale]CAG9715995.1 hypothetical protein CNEO_380032 [Clostridium neonatale]CAI3203500.1 hypothetical protein CNEO2_330067 [Clostridium neonatale]CAI3205027.1 hypothetical protein CNEO2_320067 [Clostridium neonatale]CAI3205259.1 hypothetical protein CNEO2_270055 [Clostridium neonatale]
MILYFMTYNLFNCEIMSLNVQRVRISIFISINFIFINIYMILRFLFY